jgi:hypothetical protein
MAADWSWILPNRWPGSPPSATAGPAGSTAGSCDVGCRTQLDTRVIESLTKIMLGRSRQVPR